MTQDNSPKFRKAWAIHPQWSGNVLLSAQCDLAVHESTGNRGRYRIADGHFTVWWENFDPDHFTQVSGSWVHHKVLAKAVGTQDISVVRVFHRNYVASGIRLVVPEAGSEVELRLNTSDIPTFQQVFIDAEYESPDLPSKATTIVDLGGNIGLATLYFAARYPDANILTVEPEPENFSLLLRNTASLGTRVHRHQAAVWLHDGQISLRTEDEANRPLGAWGMQVTAEPRLGEARVPSYRLSTLLNLAGFTTVDILKVDIEGAELELFSEGVQDCLAQIRMVIIETHDRFRPGSEAAVRRALDPLFEERPRRGENLVFRRKALE